MMHSLVFAKLGILKWLCGPLGLLIMGGVAMFVDGGFVGVVEAHPIVSAVVAMFIFSAAVTSMRNPWDGMYNWFFRFTHILAASADKELTDRFHLPLIQVQPSDPPPQPPQSTVTVETSVHQGGSQQP